MERSQGKKGLTNALQQCREIRETFQGSDETLRLICRVEESLRRLIVQTD